MPVEGAAQAPRVEVRVPRGEGLGDLGPGQAHQGLRATAKGLLQGAVGQGCDGADVGDGVPEGRGQGADLVVGAVSDLLMDVSEGDAPCRVDHRL